MPLDPAQLPELQTELLTDPTGALEAAGFSIPILLTNDPDLGDIEDVLEDRSDPLGSGTVDHEQISLSEVRAAIRFADFKGLTAQEQSYMQFCIGGSGSFPVDDVFKLDWTNRTPTGQWGVGAIDAPEKILALIEFTGSRLEVLFGEGANTTTADIANALNLP